LPAELHERYRDRFVTMPILSHRVRSLNLSTSVAIALYEVLRQRRDIDKRNAGPAVAHGSPAMETALGAVRRVNRAP
jgi:tRNA C32,U32 (ribose-2'-O)-methylase TrmJ